MESQAAAVAPQLAGVKHPRKGAAERSKEKDRDLHLGWNLTRIFPPALATGEISPEGFLFPLFLFSFIVATPACADATFSRSNRF